MRRPAGGSEKSTNVSIGSFRSASFALCFLDEDDDENNEDGDEDEDGIGLSCSTMFCLFSFRNHQYSTKKVEKRRKKGGKEREDEKGRN